jgi:SPP1 gp7 family putative phage head morphogenesis protein
LNILPILKRVFRDIYNTKKAPLVNEALLGKTKNKFWAAIKSGYAVGPAGVTGGDVALIQALQKNAVTFSLFKNHQNMREVAALLTTDKGELRDYEDFEREALKVSESYNRVWLNTEYNTAVSTAKAASQWQTIQATKKEFPLLQYVTQHDERVRHEHHVYDNTILPVDHPFWNTHTPPNGFNCRCYLKQLRAADSQGKPFEVTKAPNEESYGSQFNFNAGKTGEIFGENHTYYQDLDDVTVKRLHEYAENVSLKSGKWW